MFVNERLRYAINMVAMSKAGRLHALYDWGAIVTLVTQAAAKKTGIERRRQPAMAIAGLGGRCTMVDSYYMVPVIDGNDKVQNVKALGVDHITTLAAMTVPADIERSLPQAKGFEEKLARPAACGEQPGRGQQPAADAVHAEPALHPDGQHQNGEPGRRHSGRCR